MKSVQTNNVTAYLLTCTVGCLFILAGCSSDDDSPVVDSSVPTDPTATISGTVKSFSGDMALEGVVIEGVYTEDVANAMTSTDASGNFSLTVDTGKELYVHGSLTDFAPLNTELFALSTSITSYDIEMPTAVEAQEVINAAFPTARPPLESNAFLAVDIYDPNTDDEIAGKTITTTVTPDGVAYIDCNELPSATGPTVACPDREGVMYLAYFSNPAAAVATVTVQDDNISKKAPLIVGEITVLEYEIAATVVDPDPIDPVDPTPSAGQLIYEAQCLSCHPSAAALAGTGSQLRADESLAYIHPSMGGIVLTQAEVDALVNYLDVELLQ